MEPFSVPVVPVHVAGAIVNVLLAIAVVQGCAFARKENKQMMVIRTESFESIR